MFVAAVIAGLVIATFVWAVASHYLAIMIVSSESREPDGSIKKHSRAFEIVVCGTLFLVCVGLAFLIAALLVG